MDKALYLRAKDIQDQILKAKMDNARAIALYATNPAFNESLKDLAKINKDKIKRLEKEFEAL